MFTAHITGWSKAELMACPVMELYTWYQEALKLHNFLNTPDKEDETNGSE